jgi:hypothetical protein
MVLRLAPNDQTTTTIIQRSTVSVFQKPFASFADRQQFFKGLLRWLGRGSKFFLSPGQDTQSSAG